MLLLSHIIVDFVEDVVGAVAGEDLENSCVIGFDRELEGRGVAVHGVRASFEVLE